jgi:hypothetical protein
MCKSYRQHHFFRIVVKNVEIYAIKNIMNKTAAGFLPKELRIYVDLNISVDLYRPLEKVFSKVEGGGRIAE